MTRIVFTTDLHGSDICFRKLLNAGKIHKANAIIVGGDITGKAIVPMVEEPDGSYRAYLFEAEHVAKDQSELKTLEKRIGSVGFYALQVSQKEYEELSTNKTKLDETFKSLMTERIRAWVSLAEEHFKGTQTKFFLMPGNDDIFDIDPLIQASDYVVNPEGRVVNVDEHHEMISTGFSNMTPWKCPRDIPEEELAKKLEAMTAKVSDMKNAVFCFHVPPYGTNVDQAPKLDEKLQIVFEGGQVLMASVGSTAVRAAIEKYQPLLGLHGHIHESKAIERIGRTLCLNPGSEYGEGILHCALVNIDEKSVRGHMLITG